jgi:hypothetical protein
MDFQSPDEIETKIIFKPQKMPNKFQMVSFEKLQGCPNTVYDNTSIPKSDKFNVAIRPQQYYCFTEHIFFGLVKI